MPGYIEPQVDSSAYTCPFCEVLATVSRSILSRDVAHQPIWLLTRCDNCSREILWQRNLRRWPIGLAGPLPHVDMPADVLSTYNEAREVAATSPRSAAALLRLALQELVTTLAEGETNLNTAIGKLVAAGLPVRVQQAMDVLRVIGNNAVHPGEIQVGDQPATVEALFKLLNLIVEDRITGPAEVQRLFDSLPDGAREAIERRDQSR